MNNKILLKVILFLVMVVLLTGNIIADSYDSSEEDNWSGSTPIEEGDDGGDVDWDNAVEEGEDEGDYNSEDDPGFSLYMEMRLYCHDTDRDGDAGGHFVVSDGFTKYGHLYTNDISEETDDLYPFFPFTLLYSLSISPYFSEPEDTTYEWRSDEDITRTQISVSSDDVFENAKLHRFEGTVDTEFQQWDEHGCVPYAGIKNTVDFTGTSYVFDILGNIYLGEDLTSGAESIKVKYNDDLGHEISWDSSSTADDCEAIGAAWTDESAFTGYRCCGDDRMWLKNRAVNEEEGFTIPTIDDDTYDELGSGDSDVSESSYCLYGGGDTGETGLTVTYIDLTTDTYICGATGFTSYDDSLEEDDAYKDDLGVTVAENSEVPFFFQGADDEGTTETDIGKWSDSSGSNPQFCYYEYNEATIGEEYYWIDINEAGDKPVDDEGEEITDFNNDHASTICEKYLGGVWTGSHCCGNKYDYESNYDFTDTSFADTDSDEEYIDESFSEDTAIYSSGTDYVIHNYACVEGNVIDSVNVAGSTVPQTAHQKTTAGERTEVEVLNIDGTLYGCNLDDSLSFEPDWYTQDTLLTDTGVCDIKEETYLCNYNYSDWNGDGEADDPHWDWYHVGSGEEGSYAKNTLGYDSDTAITFVWSEPVWATEDQQPGACCAGNRCWDGTQCVEQYTPYSYDDDSDEETEDVISICYNGDWTGTLETKYDWYHNTDAAAIDYCVNAYACVCSTEEDDDTFCAENEEYVVAGCTLTADFYKDDHFCEAMDIDGDGSYDGSDDSSRWTSRTKFLAFQMIQIAQDVGTEFTLFCDQYSDTLNNYVDVEAIAEDINSFCILSQDSDVTIGVTFNSDDEDQPMTIDAAQVEELLFGSNAFVTDIIGNEDVETCSSATSYTSSERFGEFYSCDGSTEQVFYNTKLNAVIYSENGLGTTLLSYSDTDAMQELLDGTSGAKTTISTYIDTTDDDELVNPAGDEIKENFAGFSTVEDYSSLYYSTENSATIIGFEDVKYDGESDNRYYMGVLYDSITLDCDQIYAPYDDAVNIYCSDNAGTGIILERSTEGSEFWRSLTAGIRRE